MNKQTKEYVKMLQGKKIFIDFDGTLCEYRYNNHILGDEDIGGQTRAEILFGDAFINARALNTTKKFLSCFNFDDIYILGQVVSKHEIDQKMKWLKVNYPKIKEKNIFFISESIKKYEVLEEFSKYTDTKRENIVLIDDKLRVLREVEKVGFLAFHITSLVD